MSTWFDVSIPIVRRAAEGGPEWAAITMRFPAANAAAANDVAAVAGYDIVDAMASDEGDSNRHGWKLASDRGIEVRPAATAAATS